MRRTYMWACVGAVVFLAGPSSQAGAQPVTTVYFGGSRADAVGTPEPTPDGEAHPSATAPEDSESSVAPAAPPTSQETPAEPAATRPLDEPVETSPADEPSASRRCPGPVTLERRMGGVVERATMPLLDCEGALRPLARRALAVLMRGPSVPAPSAAQVDAFERAEGDVRLLVEGVPYPHAALLQRLQRIGDAFPDAPIEILSGHRPGAPASSRHHHARALDLRVRGVEPGALRATLSALAQTGIGWHAREDFVHLDVRPERLFWEGEGADGGRRVEAPSSAAPSGLLADELDALRGLSVPSPWRTTPSTGGAGLPSTRPPSAQREGREARSTGATSLPPDR